MDSKINMPVLTADNGATPDPGKVLIACTDDHLDMTPNLTLRYSEELQKKFIIHPLMFSFSMLPNTGPQQELLLF